MNLSIERRRELLGRMLTAPRESAAPLALIAGATGQVLEAVRKLGLEGVVGKRIDSACEPGERSGAWIKHRTNREQEFVSGGYVPGAQGFDALLVGVYENKELIFVAKVKNGFVPRIRDEIFPALKTLKAAHCLFKNLPETRASRWGEVAYRRENEAMPLGHSAAGLPASILDCLVHYRRNEVRLQGRYENRLGARRRPFVTMRLKEFGCAVNHRLS